jgi:hypothetical protein
MAALKKRNIVVITVIITIVAIVLSTLVYLNSQKPTKDQTIIPDFTNYGYSNGLASVKPESVTIIT